MMKSNKSDDMVKVLSILITFMMIMLSISIFFINKSIIIAKADNIQEESAYSDNNKEDDLFIHVLNKTMTLMEYNYKKNNKNKNSNLAKHFVEKIINFDYQNPKTYLGAQISMIKGVENDLEVVSQRSGGRIDNEDYDTRKIYIPDTDNTVDNSQQIEKEINSNTSSDDIVVFKDDSKTEESSNSNTQNSSDNNNWIVSTPVPPPKKFKHDKSKPLILIYHTHGTESYKPESVGNYHSLNRQYTVIRIGEILKKQLGNSGYKVVHDDTLHDYPSYQGSYNRSLNTLNKNLENEPSLKVVFDVHRDGIDQVDNLENYEELRSKSLIEINGEKVARYSLVVGGGNENIDELKKFAYYIKAISDELYPGLASQVILKKYKYNQYKSDYYALLEVGSNVNTIDESIRTSKYLGEIIDRALRGFVEIN